MKNILYILLIQVLLACPFWLYAQKGDLFLYNYDIPVQNIDYQNYAATQGGNGLLYFANLKGILSYDGVSWEMVATQNTPYSLATSSKGKVYVGCRESFGYLITDKTGRDKYISISGKHKNFGEIIQIILTGKYGYFYSKKALFKLNLHTNKVEKIWKPGQEEKLNGIFYYKERVYLNTSKKGLHKIENDALVLIPETEEYAGLEIKTSISLSPSQLILGLSDHTIYLFNGKKLFPYHSTSQEYIEGNFISSGLNLGQNMFALATLSGGVVILDSKTNQTKYIVNYQTGLPDDEVFAMCLDKQGGLWICHAKGISRADLQLPIYTYSSYAGLEGNIETALAIDSSLFVATSDGLFYLSKVKQYEEVHSFIKKEAKYVRTVETVTKKIQITEPTQATRIRRYRHSHIGTKAKKRKIIVEEEKETENNIKRVMDTELSSRFFSSTEARKAYALQSIPYIFKKVEGLSGKCRQLLYHKGNILIVSNLGLHSLRINQKKLETKAIIEEEYINFIYPSAKNHDYFYIGTQQGVVVIAYEAGIWRIKKEKDLQRQVHSIIEHENSLWLGTESQVFKIKLKDNFELGKVKEYPFQDVYSENIIVRLIKGKLAFILSSGIYSYNASKDQIFKNAKIQKYFNPQSSILFKQPGYTWLKNIIWQNISHPSQKMLQKSSYFEFFKDIQDIFIDAHQNSWVVANNTLYKISNQPLPKNEQAFKIFIKNIFHNPEQFLPLDKVIFAHQKKSLPFTFKLAAPFYRNEQKITYQYWLEGLDKKVKWSDWSSEALIVFPYLPSGKYILHIRAKNIFGEKSKEQTYSFEIQPPFWETTWFYGLQVLVMIGLLLLSFLFNRSGKRSTLSFILSVVSIITLFEFFVLLLEPYVEEYSNGIPVFKLGMNILLALSLFPLERLLSSFLYKPSEKIKKTTEEKTGDLPKRKLEEEQED